MKSFLEMGWWLGLFCFCCFCAILMKCFYSMLIFYSLVLPDKYHWINITYLLACIPGCMSRQKKPQMLVHLLIIRNWAWSVWLFTVWLRWKLDWMIVSVGLDWMIILIKLDQMINSIGLYWMIISMKKKPDEEIAET